MILASAIKFYIESSQKEVILCGSRHGDVFKQLDALGFHPRRGYKEIEQGFIDHRNNFLTRQQALEHAYECGQLSSRLYHSRKNHELVGGEELFSEDLW